MTVIFRVILVIVSILTMAFMMRKIRQAKVQIEAALFWVIMALILVVFSLFPAVADACAHLLGIYSTPNFLFLFMIFLLIVKVFGMTLQMSQMESRQKELVQRIALDQKDREELELSFEAGEKLGLGPVETGDKVRSIIGHLALQVLNQVPVSGVFLTGGDTALGMLANIEADGSEILSEIRVGIPLVRVKGGSFEGLKLVTKAGAFGEDDAVAFALRKLKETI